MPITIGSNLPLLAAFQRSAVPTRASARLTANSLGSDSSSVSIADSLRTRAGILSQTTRSVSEGQSILSLAETALKEIDTITSRLGELATAATSETLSLSERQAIQTESDDLVTEYNRIVENTDYRGVKILNQADDTLQINLGNGVTSTVSTPLVAALARETGSGTFSKSLSSGASSTYSLLYDVNNDGNLDLVTTLSSSTALNVRYGNGDGTLSAVVTETGSTGSGGILAAGDIDGDGDLDVARLSIPVSGKPVITIFRNTGGLLKPISNTTESGITSISGLALADLNGDNRADVIFGSNSTNRIYTRRMLASGNLAARQNAASVVGSFSMAVGDFTQDGKVDLLVRDSSATEEGPQAPTLYSGNGGGGFTMATYLSGIKGSPRLVSGDFNRDGMLDFSILSYSDGRPVSKILINQGNRSFTETQNVSGIGAGDTADFDGDGILDLLESAPGNVLNVAKGRGDGTFDTAQGYVVAGNLTSFGDLNRDGALDLVSTNGGVHTYLQGTTTTTSIGSLNLMDSSSANTALSSTNILITKVAIQIGTIESAQERLVGVFQNIKSQRAELAAAADRALTITQAEDTARSMADKIRRDAAAAILAQANQRPDVAVSLLNSEEPSGSVRQLLQKSTPETALEPFSQQLLGVLNTKLLFGRQDSPVGATVFNDGTNDFEIEDEELLDIFGSQ
jgi:flagellin-like hook-associated protein FlgL